MKKYKLRRAIRNNAKCYPAHITAKTLAALLKFACDYILSRTFPLYCDVAELITVENYTWSGLFPYYQHNIYTPNILDWDSELSPMMPNYPRLYVTILTDSFSDGKGHEIDIAWSRSGKYIFIFNIENKKL